MSSEQPADSTDAKQDQWLAEDDTSPTLGILTIVLAVAVGTALFLQASRVFFSYTIFGAGQFPLPAFILTTLTAILGVGLAGPLMRLAGRRATLVTGATILLLSRLVIQFWEDPAVRIAFGSIAIAAWGWFMLAMLLARRDGAALGLALGLGLDLTLGIALQTVDLPWMPGLADHVVTALVAGLFAIATVGAVPYLSRNRTAGPPITLFAIGPGLVLYHLIVGSTGLVITNVDVTYPTAALLLASGVALGIVGSFWLAGSFGTKRANVRFGVIVAGVVLGGIALWRAWSAGLFTELGFVLIAALGILLMSYMLLPTEFAEQDTRLPSATAWFTVGNVFQAVLFLIYFIGGNIAMAVGLTYLALAASVLSRRLTPPKPTAPSGPVLVAPGLLVTALIIAPLWHMFTWSTPEPGMPLDNTVTTMTYNIQTGFTSDDDFSLEEIAETIERVDPDVVVLQEVARGWPFTTGIDQANWLSERLDMSMVFGQSRRNRLWSVTILSSAPMAEVERVQFEVPDFDRGVVGALVTGGEDQDLWVFGTHFAAPRGAEAARVREAHQLLEVWNRRNPAVIAGDFNAGPDTAAMNLLQLAGLIDVGATFGTAEPTFGGNRRIDHILVTPDVQVVDTYVVESRASDHKPVVTTIRIEDLTNASAVE